MFTISRATKSRSFGIPAMILLSVMLGSCDESKSGPSAQVATGPAKLEVVGGDVVEWGNVAPGILHKTVQITNVGGDTLRIAEVKPSCGCTVAPISKTVLAPGDTATVDVSLDVANSTGAQQKNLTITSNDVARPSVPVTLKANLIRDLTVIPPMFPSLATPVVGQEFMTFVEVENTSQEAITVKVPLIMEGIPAVVRFEPTADTTLQPGGKMRVVAHVKPLQAGPINTQVIIPSTSKSSPKMKVTLAVNVNPQG